MLNKPKHSVNFSELTEKLLNKTYKLADVQHKIEKVAFDVVRFKDGDDAANLWKIEQDNDGSYIVALYDTNSEQSIKTASLKVWDVNFNDKTDTLNVFYKGDHIAKIASSKLGLNKSQLKETLPTLPKSLGSNKKLVNSLLNLLDDGKKTDIIKKFPELA